MIFKKRAIRYMVHGRSGFSLLQTSLVLMISALTLVSLLPGQGAGDSNQKIIQTALTLNKVEDAMARFMARNGRRPCPADGQYNENNANFGWEAGHASPNNPLTGCTGGTPSAPMGPDAGTSNIVAGMIPVKSLDLPDEDAYDGWGRRLTYVVDSRATTAASCYALKTGGLQVKTKDPSGTIAYTDSVMYAYMSHGPSGYGAWPQQGSTVAGRINTGIADADKQNNAGVNSSFGYSTTSFTNNLITKDRTSQFDDIVYYLDAFKNTCCIGQACSSATGFQSQGTNTNDNAGSKILTLDLNGDGMADLAICAPNASPGGRIGAGSVYVVFGSRSMASGAALPLNSLNGVNGVEIDGISAGDHLCSSLAKGDLNGDNINDLIIGASSVGSSKGAVYVVLGGAGSWPASFTVSNLNGSSATGNGNRGWVINGENSGDKLGAAVAARDFSGDDYDDVLIGAPGVHSKDGAGYVVCGGGGPWPAIVSASALAGIHVAGVPASSVVPTCGIKITSPVNAAEQFGFSAAMGNLYGDDYADIILGAPYGNVGPQNAAGKVYALCGSNGSYTTPVAAAGVTGIPGTPGTCGTVFQGVDLNYHAGWAIDSGDINGDGVMDLIIGAPNSSPLGRFNAGSTYVVYGKRAGFPATFNLNNVNISSSGFRVDGLAGDTSGSTVHATCDTNGDGAQDLIIGAPQASPLSKTFAGGAYVVFGATTNTSTFDVTNLNGSNGSAIFGVNTGDNAGTTIEGGDFYNSGLCNVIVGAPNATAGSIAGAGAVYTVLGTTSWPATVDLSTYR